MTAIHYLHGEKVMHLRIALVEFGKGIIEVPHEKRNMSHSDLLIKVKLDHGDPRARSCMPPFISIKESAEVNNRGDYSMRSSEYSRVKFIA